MDSPEHDSLLFVDWVVFEVGSEGVLAVVVEHCVERDLSNGQSSGLGNLVGREAAEEGDERILMRSGLLLEVEVEGVVGVPDQGVVLHGLEVVKAERDHEGVEETAVLEDVPLGEEVLLLVGSLQSGLRR